MPRTCSFSISMLFIIGLSVPAACGAPVATGPTAAPTQPAAAPFQASPAAPAPRATDASAPTAALPATTPTTNSTTAIQLVGHTSEVHGVAFSPDGKYVATAAYDRTVALWDATTGQRIRIFSGHTGTVETVAFSPDGKFLLTGGEDKSVRLWEVASGQTVHIFEGNAERIDGVSFSPDGKAVAAVVEAQSVKIWNIASGNILLTITQPDVVISAMFAPDGKYVATGGLDHMARLWDVATGQQLQTFSGHSNNIGSLAFSPDGKYLVTGSDDGTARVWDVATGQTVHTLAGHAAVVAVAYSPDGKYIATGSEDNTATLWDAATGAAAGVFSGHNGAVHGVAFSPDSEVLVTGSFDSTGRLWKLQDATPPSVASAPTAVVAAISTPLVDTNSQKPNDIAYGQLRLAHFVVNGPNVDLLVNGTVAVNGGAPQINMPAGYVNGYLYLEPATYSIAVVPTGKGSDQALIGPLDVPLVAGHRYTLAVIGQIENNNIKPLVIDETASERDIGAKPTDSVRITVNNLSGAAAIAAGWNEHLINDNIPSGSYGVGIYPAQNGTITVTVSDTSAPPLLNKSGDWNEPGMTLLYGFAGNYPGRAVFNGPPTSRLNMVDCLRGFSGRNLQTHGALTSFDTFLAVIEAAGLTQELASGGPYLILAPTDQAFAALPKEQLNALRTDPIAAGELVRNHIIEAYVPRGSLARTPGGPFDRTFTNLLGARIAIGEGYTVNGRTVGDFASYFVANGTQVHPITEVLLPGTK